MRILILGATGMLGYEVFRICLKRDIEVYGVVRDKNKLAVRLGSGVEKLLYEIDDIKNISAIEKIIEKVRPDYIINCIGIVKQSGLSEDYYESIAINSFLPHQLNKLCEQYSCRLIHISTDCVFDGKKGGYKESELPNAYDLYGKSKHLGEVNYGSTITLRTSIIGHEITKDTHGLLEWFLSQEGKANGFTKAIFSGFTTLELTKIILDVVIAQKLEAGLYQVAAEPISKYDLLEIIASVYHKDISIEKSETLVIDRSLDGKRFNELTNYKAPDWKVMIAEMESNFKSGY